jgi:hypothetical protein
MASAKNTDNAVEKTLAPLFMTMKLPRFMSPRKPPASGETFGESVAVKMSQRTLLLILGTCIAATLAWTNLKGEASKNHELITELTAIRANDALERKADHDLLMRVADGVERLERRADREDRRNSQVNH